MKQVLQSSIANERTAVLVVMGMVKILCIDSFLFCQMKSDVWVSFTNSYDKKLH